MDGITAVNRIWELDRTSRVPVIIISASGSENEMRRASEAGIEHYLLKPVKHSALFDAMTEAFGLKQVERRKTPPRLVTPDRFAKLKVLLVEDNPINQKLAVNMITKGGYQVVTAQNGLEAFEQYSGHPDAFDLIFMDMQMPVMDGLAATQQIRKWEQSNNNNPTKVRHVPIVAMTANALKGDREKCIGAGMDDYMTKPIDREKVYKCISQWLVRPEINDSMA
jgi:two-component system, sensor histidine kinase and response regulator